MVKDDKFLHKQIIGKQRAKARANTVIHVSRCSKKQTRRQLGGEFL